MNIEDFIEELQHIPWFEKLGKASARDTQVFRIYSWDTWPGPENPASDLQAQYHMKWQQELLGIETSHTTKEIRHLYNKIQTKVLGIVRAKVPYEEDEDAWYGPNAAAWSASRIAGWVGCTLFKQGQLLQDSDRPWSQWTLAEEWSWYQEGHWPCCYFWPWGYKDLETVERTDDPRKLVVF